MRATATASSHDGGTGACGRRNPQGVRAKRTPAVVPAVNVGRGQPCPWSPSFYPLSLSWCSRAEQEQCCSCRERGDWDGPGLGLRGSGGSGGGGGGGGEGKVE